MTSKQLVTDTPDICELMVERVARAIARATVTAAEPEKCGRLSDAAIDALVENIAVKFYPEARAALEAAHITRLTSDLEALQLAMDEALHWLARGNSDEADRIIREALRNGGSND